jgi:hypothetical protein
MLRILEATVHFVENSRALRGVNENIPPGVLSFHFVQLSSPFDNLFDPTPFKKNERHIYRES